MKKVLLSEMSWSEAKEAFEQTDLALIPVGANEAYGRHLPLGSDTIVATEISIMLAREVGAIVSPSIPVGESTPLMDFPGSMTTTLKTFTAYLRDYAKSLIKYGIRRIFVVCGHVGNVPAVSTVAYDLSQEALFAMVDLWRYIAKQGEAFMESDCIPDGHASELGTSVLMALRPDLVDMDQAVKEVPPPQYLPQPGMYQYPYLGALTKSGVIGDPALASAEKGKKVIDKTVSALVNFLGDFK